MQNDLASVAVNGPFESKANILLVDDRPADLLSLEAILEDLGHNIVNAQSGEKALQLLLEQDFAVVLLDVRMHGLDGFETARLIRSRDRSRHTPIIFLTAQDNQLDVEQAYGLGAVDYLVKPLLPVILRAKVAGFVELFQKSEQIRQQAEQLRRMERREFEQKLEQENARLRVSEERFARFMQHLPGLAWIKDAQGRYVFANDAAVKVFRILGIESLYGKTDADLFPPETAAQFKANDQQALASGAGVQVIETLKHEDGITHHSLVSKFPIPGPQGTAPLVGGMAIDITEQQRTVEALEESERRFKTLAGHAPVGIFETDAEGNCLFVNDRWCQIAGMTPEAARGKGWIAALHPEDRDRVAREWYSAATEDREFAIEYRFQTPQGNITWLSGSSVALRDDSGKIRGHIGTVTDITEPRKAAEELRQRANQLTEADRSKDEFLAMLAHELRNPLAPIRNSAQVLRLVGHADPNIQRASAMIERQVEHLTRMVDDLLDVSRITRGKAHLHKEPLDLAPALARAVETSRPLIDAHRHELTVTLPPEPVIVEGDATRLAQVVGNLLNNAAKYTEEGGQIWLTMERGPGEAVVRVRDNGTGIPADLLPKVFELFTQGDRSLARSEGGLGIGLTLVRTLVEMHGGSVEAFSEGSGKGSEFVVRLPILERRQGRRQGDVEGRTAAAPSRRVLVVDDNVDAAESLAMLLRVEGHEVHTAYDGLSALEAAREFRPEVVLLDIGLPRMSGYEVARGLRELAELEKALLVALTGYGQEEDRRRSQEAGFDAHLVKPADPAALQRLLAGSMQDSG